MISGRWAVGGDQWGEEFRAWAWAVQGRRASGLAPGKLQLAAAVQGALRSVIQDPPSSVHSQPSQFKAVLFEVLKVPVEGDELRFMQDRERGQVGVHPNLG